MAIPTTSEKTVLSARGGSAGERNRMREELVLATAYIDHNIAGRALIVCSLVALGFAAAWAAGYVGAVRHIAAATRPWLAPAVLFGAVLGFYETRRVRRHRQVYAAIERGWRVAVRSLAWEDLRAARALSQRHRRAVLLDALLPAAITYGLAALLGGIAGAVPLLAVIYITELTCWRLLWRRVALHEEEPAAIPAPRPSP